MATIVNARDVQLQNASIRLLGVQINPNVEVPPTNVPGLNDALNVRSVTLVATSQVIQMMTNGTLNPSSVTVAAQIRGLTNAPTFGIVPGSGTMSVTPALTNGSFTFTGDQLTSPSVTLRLTVVQDGTTYSDDVTFVKVQEGAAGLAAILTNENFTFPTDSAGNVSSYVGCSGRFRVYQGTNEVTSVCTFSVLTNPDTLGVTLTASGTNAGNYSVNSGFAAGLSQTTITFRATFGTTTIDKTLSLSKAKAGTNGTIGSNGVRGSRKFIVEVSGTTYSDALATTTASVLGGPVTFDEVQQQNTGAQWVQSKYWDGSAWQTVNALVDGNLLVKGSVGAKSLVLNNGSGNNLWWDPGYKQIDQWIPSTSATLPPQATVTDGNSGNTVMRSVAGVYSAAYSATRVPVTVGKQYRISVKARKSSDANGLLYLRPDSGTGPTNSRNFDAAGLEATAITTSWATYSFLATATQPFLGFGVYLNIAQTPVGYMEVQDLRIEEMMDSSLIVQGGITADRIDTRGLTIKDSNGNVIFGAGTGLDWNSINASGAKPRSLTVVSHGYDRQLNTIDTGIYLDNTAIWGFGGGFWNIVLIHPTTFGIQDAYPFGGPIVSTNNGDTAANWLNGYLAGNVKYIVCVLTDDNPQAYVTGALIAALKKCGASSGGIGSNAFLSTFRASYSFIGQLNTLPGTGIEVFSRTSQYETIASATFSSGRMMSAQKDLNIDSGNVSTYIANAAIGSLQVGQLTAANLTVGAVSDTINGGLGSGNARVVITQNNISLYNSANQIRVRLST